MSLDEGLLRFVGELYEAVHEPEGWRTAIAGIISRTENRMALITSADLRGRSVVDIQVHGREDSIVETGMREYAEEMSALDPSLNWAHTHPAAGICETAAVLRSRSNDDHPFVKWSTSRFGSPHWRAFYTQPVDGLSFAVSFDATRARADRKQMALQALLFENLERAVRLSVRPPTFADDDAALIAIDARGRPIALSQRAKNIVRAADGLEIKGGSLTATDARADRLMQQAIRASIDPLSFCRPGRGVRIERKSSRRDLLVVASRFPPSHNHLPMTGAVGLIRLIELQMRADRFGEYAHLLGLTPRETDIASALLDGHSIESMATKLGISRFTARNHVQSLFCKTQTNRQSDLVRVLDRIARQ